MPTHTVLLSVLVVIPFEDVDEAIALANDSIFGLASGVWTRDIGKAHAVARKLQAGTVWINQYNWYDSGAPFGGYKQSGFGRELGRLALDHYVILPYLPGSGPSQPPLTGGCSIPRNAERMWALCDQLGVRDVMGASRPASRPSSGRV